MLQNSKPRHKLRRIPFVDQQLSTIIQRQKQTLDKLVKQNSDSKNLIDKLMQQGTGKTKFMISSQKQLIELENQLRKITIRLDNESKRNEVLKELVSILNNEDKKSKKEEFLEINRMVDLKQKKLKKQEYDIEQILQKHNQVIAKINILKQQISSSRRERVVYSNLFKKIEKQIKIYEQSYKEILMQAHQYEKKQKVIRQQLSFKKKSERQPLNQIQEIDDEQPEQIEFLPSRRPIDIESIHVENSSPPSLPRRNPNTHKTTVMMDTLNQFKIFFDILKSETGEESVNDIIETFPVYDTENQALLARIQEIENQILDESDVLKEVNEGINLNECLFDQNAAEENALEVNCSVVESEIVSKTKEIESFNSMLADISTLLNIPLEQTQVEIIFQMIENKLESLNPEERKQSAESEAMLLKKLGENEFHIQSVIEKMDCYGESEKILSKHYLETESIRELSKHKRLTKSRK